MTVLHEITDAVPPTGGGPIDKSGLRSTIIGRTAYIVTSPEEVPDLVGLDPETGAAILVIICRGRVFDYDPFDEESEQDDVTCLVTEDGRRYKLATAADVVCFSVIDLQDAPPEEPSYGEAWLILPAPTGAWVDHDNDVGLWTSRGWAFITFGVGRLLYIKSKDMYIHRAEDGSWALGVGRFVVAANSIPLSSIVNADRIVENQTQRTPPGLRVSGAAPTAPLGGVAANLNDNDSASVTITNALGTTTGQTVAQRIAAKLDFGTVKNINAVELVGLSQDSGASTATGGLYYSTDNATWTLLGLANIGSTVTPALKLWSGPTVSARYVAYAVPQDAFAAKVQKIEGLNAYDADAAPSAATGAAFIIGPNAFGPWLGQSGKYAVCEDGATFTIYPPSVGWRAYDKALGADFRFNGAAWVSAAGAVVDYDSILTTAAASSVPAGNAGLTYTYDSVVAPQDQRHVKDPVTVTIAAPNDKAKIEIEYDAFYAAASLSARSTLAIYRDSETTALAWWPITEVSTGFMIRRKFIIDAVDALPHTYQVRHIRGSASDDHGNFQRREISWKVII